MLRLIRSLGRLSVRGYLIVAGFAVIAVLATYSNMQDQRTTAAKQLRERIQSQAHSNQVNLSAPVTTVAPSSSTQVLSDTSTSDSSNLPAPSSPVAKARHLSGALVFTPANITLSLSHKLPSVTITASDGAQISTPQVVSSTGGLGVVAQKDSATSSPSWQLQLTGHPLLGVYQVNLSASSDTTDYTGTMTVVVVL